MLLLCVDHEHPPGNISFRTNLLNVLLERSSRGRTATDAPPCPAGSAYAALSDRPSLADFGELSEILNLKRPSFSEQAETRTSHDNQHRTIIWNGHNRSVGIGPPKFIRIGSITVIFGVFAESR